MSKSILDKLRVREKFEKRILRGYKDILYRTFQVIYEIDAKVSWERIWRFSKESNFVMISGSAIVPKGTVLAGGRILEGDIRIAPSFTMPWCQLDDGSSAYEIAEAAKDIKTFGELVGGGQFVDLLRSADFTYEQLKKGIPDFETLEQQAKENNIPRQSPEMTMEEITQVQMRNMLLEDKPSE